METTDLRAVLENQIKAAEDDITRLRAALQALDGQEKPQSAPQPRRRQAAATPETKAIPWGKLVRIVAKQDGISATQLAKQTGGDQSTILTLLKEHEGDQVRREGQRRATRWFVINGKAA